MRRIASPTRGLSSAHRIRCRSRKWGWLSGCGENRRYCRWLRGLRSRSRWSGCRIDRRSLGRRWRRTLSRCWGTGRGPNYWGSLGRRRLRGSGERPILCRGRSCHRLSRCRWSRGGHAELSSCLLLVFVHRGVVDPCIGQHRVEIFLSCRIGECVELLHYIPLTSVQAFVERGLSRNFCHRREHVLPRPGSSAPLSLSIHSRFVNLERVHGLRGPRPAFDIGCRKRRECFRLCRQVSRLLQVSAESRGIGR